MNDTTETDKSLTPAQRLIKNQTCQRCRSLGKIHPQGCSGGPSSDGDEEISEKSPKKDDNQLNALNAHKNLKANIFKRPETSAKPSAHPHPLINPAAKLNNPLKLEPSLKYNLQLLLKSIEIQRDVQFTVLKLIFAMNPSHTAEQKDLIEKTLHKVWNEFIKLCPKHGSRLDIEKDANGNIISLKANIPTAFFNQFIALLRNNNLLSQADANRIQQAMNNTYLRPRAFSNPTLVRS